MDSTDAETLLGAWAWIRGYFSPAMLFLVVNLVIGTIALTSHATQQRRRREHYYHDDAHGHHLQEEPLHPQMEQPGYGHYYHLEQTLYAPPPTPTPLARTSSVLDRLRSLGLYRFRSNDFPPEYCAAVAAAAPNYARDVFAPVEEEETTATAHYARGRSEPALAAGREDERRPACTDRWCLQ
ncbi:pathogen-associated molecular patterns-induced protein A70-like [Miscanthus floridulus]|uniref:pathogen-associated molecular patterns-induced protein A70-like n=1 Tax=Miscanthus floridulus TaxID=154761 RepID=UPI0034575EE9